MIYVGYISAFIIYTIMPYYLSFFAFLVDFRFNTEADNHSEDGA